MLKWLAVAIAMLTAAGYSYFSQSSVRLEFDGNRAFEHLKRQVAFGPRPIGTLAHEKTRTYIGEELRKHTDYLRYQDFPWAANGKKYRLTNVVGALNLSGQTTVLIGAHWDTRPTADMDPDPANRSRPILGANDGASGVAVVLELARVLRINRPKIGVIFVLFDGEDYGPDIDRMFMGSQYYAAHPIPKKPDRAIVVDMVGDADLNVYKEANSVRSAPKLVDAIWSTASSLEYYQFAPYTKYTVTDDHVSFHEVGIPAIDIIDFDYPHWHTLRDTVDKCSAKSLEVVGRTLEKYLRTVGG